jgi:ABC-type multidrug transport system ATPase subunit/ABC-type Na+ efflux pump permease subunit
MSREGSREPVLVVRDLRKTFSRETGQVVQALDGVSLEVPRHSLTALVGPDGAGKTTLLRLATGLITADAGELTVLGINVAADPQQVQNRVGYMPQRFGLYEDLSVQENLDLYADLNGVPRQQRAHRYPELMEMTALGPFAKRLAGRLSGGMKQKLGLACTLVRSPELLLLDEPTVGVDPLSRRELWEIIKRLVDEEGLTVLVSTSYLDEAEHSAPAIVLHKGRVLADGPPSIVRSLAEGRTFLAEPAAGHTARELQARLLAVPSVIDAVPEGGSVRFVLASAPDQRPQSSELDGAGRIQAAEPRFEDGFMVLLHDNGARRPYAAPIELSRSAGKNGDEAVVQTRDLVRRFGAFTAVDHVSFDVRRGEVFGLLGPNGAGKTTTFRMLCGLLPASAGTLRVSGVDLRTARASARSRIGYVAQKFSLYGQLSVTENLEFFASAYGLFGQKRSQRIAWALDQFELGELARLPSEQLPGGYKRRLSMAAALIHEPDILFLDEPTSGVDPVARREFWQGITALAEQGVTVIVTTHFMEEAEYCDHVVIMDAGRVLAQGTPAEIRRHARPTPTRAPTMEDAFISIVEEARGNERNHPANSDAGESIVITGLPRLPLASAQRVYSLVRKESRQMIRDASSVAIGIVLPVVLILLFGYGLSLDVRDAPLAVVMEEASPEATSLVGAFQLSPYFATTLVTSMPRAEQLMLARKVDAIVRIRSNFARNLALSDAELQILVHGTDANRARIIEAYIQGAIGSWSAKRAAEGRPMVGGPIVVRDRLWFNEANESRYFLVPGLIVLIMTLIGAFLTALVMAREWERGTFESLFVTPVRAREILLSKTIPYFILGMVGLALCVLTARFLFHVPMRGSLWILCGASALYLLVALNIGLLVSAAVKSQFVASELTIIITFLPAMMLSGFLFDLRSMPTVVRLITYALPARWFVAILQTVFLAGNIWVVFWPSFVVLAFMALGLRVMARHFTRKQLS